MQSDEPDAPAPADADEALRSHPAETPRAAAARAEREARQAAALRANLRRRKQQARSRTDFER